jgi:hypothetical protein
VAESPAYPFTRIVTIGNTPKPEHKPRIQAAGRKKTEEEEDCVAVLGPGYRRPPLRAFQVAF